MLIPYYTVLFYTMKDIPHTTYFMPHIVSYLLSTIYYLVSTISYIRIRMFGLFQVDPMPVEALPEYGCTFTPHSWHRGWKGTAKASRLAGKVPRSL